MITIYKNDENGLHRLNEIAEGCWISVVDPSLDEVNELQKNGIPQDYLTSALDLDELARTEREDGEQLIVLRIPSFQGHAEDIPYTTIPLGIIINEKYLITVCRRETDLLRELTSGRIRNLSTRKRHRFVLRIFLATANKYLVYLREINKTVDKLEDQLQESTRNREVLELLKYQKSLTYFTTALKSNELMMERLHKSGLFKLYEEDEELLEDVFTENQQAIVMTNIASNILSSMMDAFASIISNNLNGVMKILASITIVLSLPTMIASFFGMNLDLPLQGHPQAFLVTLALSLISSSFVVAVFLKRDWF